VLILSVVAAYRDYVSVCIKGEEGNSMAEPDKEATPQNLALNSDSSTEADYEIENTSTISDLHEKIRKFFF
jgi:hypothetical protein